MQYKVVKEYKDGPEQPIKVVKGEILQCVEESNPDGDWPNWVFCKGEGKQGWVPKQILTLLDNQATVQQDYYAIEHCLSVGELLTAHSTLNGWIWGVKIDAPQECAWAPLNHLAQD
jgi:hypothetical protein